MSFAKGMFSFSKDDEFRRWTILGIKIKKRYKQKSKITKKNNKSQLAKDLALMSLRDVHSQVFPQYKNINDGKDVVIIATGPTLADYKPIENCVNIGLNRAYQYDKVKLDYLFLQDGTATKSYIDEIDKLEDIVKFYGVALFNEEYREGVRIPEYHLKSKNSHRYYSYNYIDCSLNSNLSVYPLFTHASVSFPAIHFALWTHPRKIYLVGCDSTAAPYWDGKGREQDYLVQAEKVNNNMIEGYKKLKTFADLYYPDVEIISINPVGLKGIFKDVYTK